jgi:hypothetical protein
MNRKQKRLIKDWEKLEKAYSKASALLRQDEISRQCGKKTGETRKLRAVCKKASKELCTFEVDNFGAELTGMVLTATSLVKLIWSMMDKYQDEKETR